MTPAGPSVLTRLEFEQARFRVTGEDTEQRPEPLVEPTSRVIVLVPAHNEEKDIANTVASLHRQSHKVDRIIVICDNCTDSTEAIVAPLDCETFIPVNNKQKKAGALNQALVPLLETLDDRDRILAMDADSELSATFVEYALKALEGDEDREHPVGAISAAYVGKNISGLLPLMQRTEYVMERRRIGRKKGKVTCLSGVACLISVKALRHLVRERGRSVPGRVEKPDCYLSVSLTEDFEITLALKTLGYRPLSPKECVCYTDLMPTVKMLWSQRLRWQRGTLETLRLYGLTRVTYPMFVTQFYTYVMSLASPFMFLLWGLSLFVLHTDLHFTWYIALLLPLSVVEQCLGIRKLRSWKGYLLVVLLLPLWLYDNLRSVIYWYAVLKMLKREEFAWD